MSAADPRTVARAAAHVQPLALGGFVTSHFSRVKHRDVHSDPPRTLRQLRAIWNGRKVR